MHQDRTGTDLYREAGVDTQQGDALVDWLHSGRERVENPTGQVVSGIGGFAALFRPNLKGLKDPLIVSSTDGVGTKVLLGLDSGHLEGLGLDLVAMCVNDLYTLGARPMFFLDYYATGKLADEDFKRVLSGIKQGCARAKMSLIGGETAELPGLYQGRHFDLAGFVVGIVDSQRKLGPENVRSGDLLYALQSSGFHSNGYSLLRKWLKEDESKGKPSTEIIHRVMTPTYIYAELPELFDELGVEVLHAAANITGGGISGNLPRVIPQTLACRIDSKAIPIQPWARDFILSHVDSLTKVESVFNLGAGMIACVDQQGQDRFESACKRLGLPAFQIGEVLPKKGSEEVQFQ